MSSSRKNKKKRRDDDHGADEIVDAPFARQRSRARNATLTPPIPSDDSDDAVLSDPEERGERDAFARTLETERSNLISGSEFLGLPHAQRPAVINAKQRQNRSRARNRTPGGDTPPDHAIPGIAEATAIRVSVDQIVGQWPSPTPDNSINNIIRVNMRAHLPDPGVLENSEVIFTRALDLVRNLHQSLFNLLKNVPPSPELDVISRATYGRLIIAMNRIDAAHRIYNANNQYSNGGANLLTTAELNETIRNSENCKSVHHLHLHILNKARELQLRKKGEMLFAQYFILPAPGSNAPAVATNTWLPHSTIESFVNLVCRKEEHSEMWVLLKRNSVKMIAEQIQNSYDAEIPLLEFHRTLFAFRNGVYSAADNNFIPRDPATGLVDTSAIDHGKVPCNYFDTDFDTTNLDNVDAKDIPVPSFQSVLDYQQLHRPYHILFAEDREERKRKGVSDEEAERILHVDGVDDIDVRRHLAPPATGIDHVMTAIESLTDDDRRKALGLGEDEPLRPFSVREVALVRSEQESVCNTLYMMIGRMIFPLGELDGMQVAMFIKGITRTGKSTIGMQIFNIFPSHLTKVLSATIQPEFGLDGFQDKYMFGCLEMKKSCRLDPTLLQSIITGERLQINRKFKLSEDLLWTLTGFFIGNEYGPWPDPSGCISLRFLSFLFNSVVPEVERDSTLADRMRDEMGPFLVRCVRLYLEFCSDEANYKRPALSRVSKYFRWTTMEMQKELNPIFNVVYSGKFAVCPDRYISFQDFRDEVKNEGLKMSGPDIRSSIRASPNPSIRITVAPMYYGAQMVTQEYILGFGLADETRRMDMSEQSDMAKAMRNSVPNGTEDRGAVNRPPLKNQNNGRNPAGRSQPHHQNNNNNNQLPQNQRHHTPGTPCRRSSGTLLQDQRQQEQQQQQSNPPVRFTPPPSPRYYYKGKSNNNNHNNKYNSNSRKRSSSSSNGSSNGTSSGSQTPSFSDVGSSGSNSNKRRKMPPPVVDLINDDYDDFVNSEGQPPDEQ